ncbi:embryonic testis differentiation protein homolog B-like [Canis aureus]
MEKENSEFKPSPSTTSDEKNEKTSGRSKQTVPTKNVLHFLLERQLGRHQSDVDLSRWLWMLT